MTALGKATAAAASSLDGSGPVAPLRTTSFAWYVAGVLALAQIVSIMDRYLLSVVLEEVKRELVLTDTQLGLLQGPSFVLLFVLASLPFGRLADLANRKWIITLAVTFWSFATIACAFAETFHQLMFARLAVGLGEAALMPAAVSIIVAMFTSDKLSRGMSVFTTGGSLGRAVGFTGGGAVLGWASGGGALAAVFVRAGFSPWQTVFLVGGVVGFGVALLIALTLREPPRRAFTRSAAGFRPALRHFATHWAGYLAIFVPFSMVNAIVQMLGAWSVSFFFRRHEVPPAESGALIGLTVLVVGPIGHIFGGWLNDSLAQRGVRGVQPLVLGMILVVSPFLILGFISAPTIPVAAAVFGLFYGIGAISGPTSYSGAQAPTPEANRGVISAIFLVFYTLLGHGLGPLVAGMAGDALASGANSLGRAMAISTLVFAVVGILFALFGRPAFIRAAATGQTPPP